jgi:hypothetical protein
MHRRLLTLVVAFALGAAPAPARTEPDETAPPELPVPVVTLDALPLPIATGELPGAARARAEGVLARSIFAQRVSGIRYPSREDVFRFLIDHPDFAAGVARALRVGEYRLKRLDDDAYWGDDKRGATGVLRLLHSDEHHRLYHL